MTTRFRLPFLALAILGGPVLAPALAHAQQSPQDFQLPPAPTPTPTPDVQGPVDTENPARPVPSPTPTPAQTPRPTIVLPSPQPSPRPSASPTARPTAQATSTSRPVPENREAPAAPPSDQQTVSEPEVEATPLPGADSSTGLDSTPIVPPAAPPSPGPELATGPEDAESGLWWVGALGLLGLAALGGGYALRRRRARAAPPQIERPVVASPPLDERPAEERPVEESATTPVTSATPPPNALALRIEALRLNRSFMNATLAYRVTVLNRSASPLSEVAIEADLASAHGDLPVDQQVAGAGTALQERHTTSRLAAGQSARFEGQVTLPLAQARVIRQGNVALLVPLLRMRSRAAGIEPVARTLAIGPAASGGGARLVPFNLDDGPRSYEPLAQKIIA